MEVNHRDIDNIDAILYINLEHRTDRKEHVLNEINKICTVQEKIYRIDAIKHDEGSIGCYLSHIKALTFALANEKWDTILILEDDFTFRENNFSEIKDSIIDLLNFNSNFDVALLSFNTKVDFYYIFHTYSKVVKIERSNESDGYIIRRHYILKLLQNFSDGHYDMTVNGCSPYNALDKYWQLIQKTDNWYSTNPTLGYQYDDYSDIRKRYVINEH